MILFIFVLLYMLSQPHEKESIYLQLCKKLQRVCNASCRRPRIIGMRMGLNIINNHRAGLYGDYFDT